MKNLIIPHKRKKSYIWLILGLLMFALGVVGHLLSDGESTNFSFGIFLVYITTGIYKLYLPYIKVSDNQLWVSSYPFRKISLDNVSMVKHFLDETTITSNGKETLISTQEMNEGDKERFVSFLKAL